jgi:hypothetical protein
MFVRNKVSRVLRPAAEYRLIFDNAQPFQIDIFQQAERADKSQRLDAPSACGDCVQDVAVGLDKVVRADRHVM